MGQLISKKDCLINLQRKDYKLLKIKAVFLTNQVELIEEPKLDYLTSVNIAYLIHLGITNTLNSSR
jgi:hypothetical protein